MKRQDDGGDFTRRLIALKRFEKPDPYFETRNLAALRERLAHTAPGESWVRRWFGALGAAPHPGLRALVAACVLALLLGNLLLINSVPNLDPVARPAADAPDSIPGALQVAATNDALDLYRKPVFVFEYPSNRQPVGPVQVGPASMPVRLDY